MPDEVNLRPFRQRIPLDLLILPTAHKLPPPRACFAELPARPARRGGGPRIVSLLVSEKFTSEVKELGARARRNS